MVLRALGRTMICILHGYLLEGSGSNLWTRAIVDSLCRQGETVHLMAQENHPERYEFIGEARVYPVDGDPEMILERPTPLPGRCILHKPQLGDVLPVYVHDRYEEFSRVVPMVDLSDAEVESYIDRNVRVLLRVVEENGITALHANHAVLMSVVAERVWTLTGVPFAIYPHGSALEYAVKRDERFRRYAESAFSAARRVFVQGEEMRTRVLEALPGAAGVASKVSVLRLGVDTSHFEPVEREGRSARIRELAELLRPLPRGRTPEGTDAMLRAAANARSDAALASAIALGRPDDLKRPDADAEARLLAVDWARDPVLLYVGRLISSKGVDGVVAAMPLLLRDHPQLRLVVVGHGPLREPLEVLLMALRSGDRALAETVIARGGALERAAEGTDLAPGASAHLPQAAAYLERLRDAGALDDWFDAARAHLRPESVVFTGYLTHRELRHLFPCADAAVFPSLVREAGPLVFLEALASGTFPLGTYFGGMAASIDAVADSLSGEVAEAMKLDPSPEGTVADIVRRVPAALAAPPSLRHALAHFARERYDWSSIARQLRDELGAM